MRVGGFGFDKQPEPPSSETLARLAPYVDTSIEAFGPSRCMLESNFPVDKGSYSYQVFWNACKLLTKGASSAERADLFAARPRGFIGSTRWAANGSAAAPHVARAQAYPSQTGGEVNLVHQGGEDDLDGILTNFNQRRCVDRAPCSFCCGHAKDYLKGNVRNSEAIRRPSSPKGAERCGSPGRPQRWTTRQVAAGDLDGQVRQLSRISTARSKRRAASSAICSDDRISLRTFATAIASRKSPEVFRG